MNNEVIVCSDKARAVINHLIDKGYVYLGSGSTRAAFRSPNGFWVVKVPRDGYGELDNFKEYDKWVSRGAYDIPFARCKLLDNYLLVMEYLTPAGVDEYRTIPWTWRVDCGQVGYNRTGKLVAYDYADCN